jgi:hypothetical protein
MVATVSLKSRQIENPLIDLTAGLGDDLPLLDMTLSALPLLDFSWITSTAVPQQFMAPLRPLCPCHRHHRVAVRFVHLRGEFVEP